MNSQSYVPLSCESNYLYKLPLLLLALAVLLSPLSCDSPADANEEDPAPDEVEMGSQTFEPSTLEVEVGTTVTWINTSDVGHTVTSGSDGDHDGIFDSGAMEPGDEFSYTFEEEGTYNYYCIPHLDVGMTGTITVTSGN